MAEHIQGYGQAAMDDLLQEFIAETRETLAAIAGELVAWEADPQDRARLDAVFRFVHTVKGSCGFLDLPRLARLSHAAEDVLADLRADRRKPDARIVSAVLGIIDRIGELAEAIVTGESLPDDEDERLIAALTGEATAKASPVPTIPPKRQAAPGRPASRSLRLPIDLLDRMMGGVSDMVLARNELARKLREADAGAGVDAAFERLSASIAEMREAITRTRMQRIDNIFSALPRLVRDLSGELGKLVMLDVDGGDVELDREMIEMIRDPLTHIVRNAIDHGIEAPDDRRAAGKSAAGRLSVIAAQSGNQILIRVSDDGRGLDGEVLARRAMAAGLLSSDRAAMLSAAQKLDLIFEPGLTTADRITAISGRGVGMDIVRANIERIGGLIDVESRPGHGLTLTLRVPLTLTIIPALTVAAAGQQFAIPRSAIEEIMRTAGGGIRVERVAGVLLATIRGRKLPVVRLDHLIGAEGAATVPPIVVVLKPAGCDGVALAVDAVLDHEELVVKPAAPAVMATGLYGGTTLPDNGRPMLLLEPAGIAMLSGAHGMMVADAGEDAVVEADGAEGHRVPSLLFRDLDGMERAIRLSLVERIEEISPDTACRTAGRLRLTHEGGILPLHAVADHAAAPRLRFLLLNDGRSRIAHAIGEVIDIVDLPADLAPVAEPGRIAGVVLLEDRQIEMIDPHWLFAELGEAADPGARPPLVLLSGGDTVWLRDVLQPLVEAAGYRVAGAEGSHGEPVDIIITAGDLPEDIPAPDIPVIRLSGRPDADGDAIYRYDRRAITDALRQRAPGQGG